MMTRIVTKMFCSWRYPGGGGCGKFVYAACRSVIISQSLPLRLAATTRSRPAAMACPSRSRLRNDTLEWLFACDAEPSRCRRGFRVNFDASVVFSPLQRHCPTITSARLHHDRFDHPCQLCRKPARQSSFTRCGRLAKGHCRHGVARDASGRLRWGARFWSSMPVHRA
jgi:hypothetical protein